MRSVQLVGKRYTSADPTSDILREILRLAGTRFCYSPGNLQAVMDAQKHSLTVIARLTRILQRRARQQVENA